MDISKNVVLKENYTFLVADAKGQVRGGEHGLYNRDTRFLSRYSWSFGDGTQTPLIHTPRPDTLEAHDALIEGPSQVLGVRRRLELRADGLDDSLTLENTSPEPRKVTLTLALASDFGDMFEARGWQALARSPITLGDEGGGYALRYRAQDGVTVATRLEASPRPDAVTGETLVFQLTLEPGQRRTLNVAVRLETPYPDYPGTPYEAWLQAFLPPDPTLSQRHQEVLLQAQQDLRALLLFTEHGPYLAAGIPWYVAAFGRDALLSASMLLPHQPEVTEGVLRFLAAKQGQVHDTFRAEEPGKIMHELRYGELTRSGKVPFGPYYGTVDATPLFVMVLWQHFGVTQDAALIRELRPHWEAALNWMTGTADGDGDGFLEFTGVAPGQGLTVQT